jgi:hypothetical protein
MAAVITVVKTVWSVKQMNLEKDWQTLTKTKKMKLQDKAQKAQ